MQRNGVHGSEECAKHARSAGSAAGSEASNERGSFRVAGHGVGNLLVEIEAGMATCQFCKE